MHKLFINTFLVVILSYFPLAYSQTSLPKENVEQPPVETEPFSQINLIFFQNATSALLEESNVHSGYYLLTLYNVSPYMTYFAQRPNRNKGVVPLQNFVKAWSVGPNNFKDNNPNAIILAEQINDAVNRNNPPLIVTLSDPQYNSDKNTLQFLAKPLSSEKLLYKESTYQYVTILIE